MNVGSVISSNLYDNKQKQIVHARYMARPNLFGLKIASSLSTDTISFSGRILKLPPKERMTAFAIKFLEEIKLKEDQPLHITAESKHVPFLKVMADEAYKKGSGRISMEVIEPEIEALKKKYGITETFDYKKEARKELEDEGALFVKFDNKNCPYTKSGLTKKEISELVKSLYPKIPKKIQNIFKLNPEEIFKTLLDMNKGESIQIGGEREHFPRMVKLVEYLYSINKSKLVNINITEPKEFDPKIAFYNHAKDSLFTKGQKSLISQQQEFLDKDTAILELRGGNPEQYSEIDPKKIDQLTNPDAEEILQIYNKRLSYNPWLVYWIPTTKAAIYAYPEHKSNELKALEHALKDAVKINRIGKMGKHAESLRLRSAKLNKLLDKGYRTIHYVSIDPTTKMPDGKTDLKVGLSSKSFFIGGRKSMPTGHKPITNVPTEETYSSPKANSVEGKVSATVPLVLSGKIIEGIEFQFKKGKVVNINATKNLEMLKKHIKSNKNANMLGEVSIVADSPISKLNRLFYSNILDENTTCHIALGNAYMHLVKGPGKIKTAAEIKDPIKLKAYLKKLHINSSTTHNDLMIGGPNVYVYAENPKTGKQVQIIKDDKFLL